jgi:hypothetical protein
MADRPKPATTQRSRVVNESNNDAAVHSPELAQQTTSDAQPQRQSRLPGASLSLAGITNPLPTIEKLLKREEADLVLLVGNVALVAFEIIEWPVAVLTLAVHALARTRFKALEALAEVAEEAE